MKDERGARDEPSAALRRDSIEENPVQTHSTMDGRSMSTPALIVTTLVPTAVEQARETGWR